jgi:hypothetical protein
VVISGFPDLTEEKANALTQELKNSLTHKTSSKPAPQSTQRAQPAPAGSKTATKLTEKFKLPSAFQEWAASEPRSISEVDIDKLFSGFRKYWSDKPGQAAFKTDWMEAWQRWVIKRTRVPKARPGPVRTEKFNALAYVNKSEAEHGNDPKH